MAEALPDIDGANQSVQGAATFGFRRTRTSERWTLFLVNPLSNFTLKVPSALTFVTVAIRRPADST